MREQLIADVRRIIEKFSERKDKVFRDGEIEKLISVVDALESSSDPADRITELLNANSELVELNRQLNRELKVPKPSQTYYIVFGVIITLCNYLTIYLYNKFTIN